MKILPCTAAAILIVLTFLPALAGDDAEGAAASPAKRDLYPAEVPDDAPAPTVPRDDDSARSFAATIGLGSYVSVQVNVDSQGQNIVGDAANEPSIAVNPIDLDNIVIGWRQFDTIASNFRQGGWSYTTDGGLTWTFPGVLTPGTFRSDPVLGADRNGNFHYQSLKSSLLMDVFTSTDGGMTWGSPVPSFGGDKNWMVVDATTGVGAGNLYGIWREPFGCCGADVFTRSTDFNQTWEDPLEVPQSPGLGTMAVGPDGEVYVTGIAELGSGAVVLGRSTDAKFVGSTPTFSTVTVDLGGDLVFGGSPNPGGLIGQINVAVDSTTGPSRGYVYVLSTVNPDPPFGSQPAAVHIVRSEDGGDTWSQPVVVNDDPVNNGAWHWFAAHAVAPNARIDVIWNDTRNTGQSTMSQLYYSYSYDLGETWSPNAQVSPSFNSTVGWPNQNKIGDYYTIISDLTGANVAYSATFNGEQDVYHARVFPDCNGNAVSDVTDIQTGGSQNCNGSQIPDECEIGVTCGPAGTVPDGSNPSSAPLTVTRAAEAGLLLSWDPSCKMDDNDFGIYEGTLGGDFTSHVAIECTTGGDTSRVIDSDPEISTYYLIVPHNGTHEGSYGTDGDGTERPAAPPADQCLDQLIGVCFGVGLP